MNYQLRSATEPFGGNTEFEEFETLDLEAFEPWQSEINPDSPARVRWTQESLNNILGIQLKVDGIMGPQTRSAIRNFQKRQGLPADGVLGPRTESAMSYSRVIDEELAQKPTLRRGSRGSAVTELQQLLTQAGFPVKVDGIFGSKTQQVVRAFQSSRGLAIDGVVGPQTWATLQGTTGPVVVPEACNPYQAAFEQAARHVGVPESWATNSALCQLVKHESAWNPNAKNPSTSAFGLFQFLKSTWKKHLPEVPYGNTDPYWQAVGGFRYIQAAYRTPERAWSFWQATVRKNPSLAPADLRRKAEQWISKGWGGYEI